MNKRSSSNDNRTLVQSYLVFNNVLKILAQKRYLCIIYKLFFCVTFLKCYYLLQNVLIKSAKGRSHNPEKCLKHHCFNLHNLMERQLNVLKRAIFISCCDENQGLRLDLENQTSKQTLLHKYQVMDYMFKYSPLMANQNLIGTQNSMICLPENELKVSEQVVLYI